MKRSRIKISRIKERMAKSYATTIDCEETIEQYGYTKKWKEFYIMGQNIASESIYEVADLLLKRDYPNIASIDEETQDFEMNLGTIFVPEGYIPKKPGIVNPDIAEQISDQFPDDMKLQGEITQTSGDLAER